MEKDFGSTPVEKATMANGRTEGQKESEILL
jgi:hypothetical protein